MPKHHPRPTNDFIVKSFARNLENERNHRNAGFPPVSREVLVRRLWQYLNFLQQNGLTSRILVSSIEDVSEQTVLQNTDLTDEGFYFIQHFHVSWLGRTHKDQGEKKENAFLEKSYKKFRQLVA